MANNAPIRVLCVEDDDNIRQNAVEALQEAGFDVLEAQDGARAAALMVDPDSVDILFTDVTMPGSLDGLELATAIRKIHPHMPLVVTSGFGLDLSRRLRKIAPPIAFISKPYSLTEIVSVLKAVAGDLTIDEV
jgi:DNA-binding NtrC family response regulator